MLKKMVIIISSFMSISMYASQMEENLSIDFTKLPIPYSGETLQAFSERSNILLDPHEHKDLLDYFYRAHNVSSYTVYDNSDPANIVFGMAISQDKLSGLPNPYKINHMSKYNRDKLRISVSAKINQARDEMAEHIRIYNAFISRMENIQKALNKADHK